MNDLKDFIFSLSIPASTKHKYFRHFKTSKMPRIKQRILRLIKLKKPGITKYRAFLLYGKNEGLKRWNSYTQKQAFSNSKEYKNITEE